jgi:hypothetical protein
MANLERIQYSPMREVIENGSARWERDLMSRPIDRLPQLFWANGESWSEANHWAKTKAEGVRGADIGTVVSLMKHLSAYANWLELEELDWRHFPQRFADRILVRYRKEIIEQRERGSIAPSTATARMAAVIQFYRHARINSFIGRGSPLWRDEMVVIRYFDSVGFERTLMRVKSELSIPNRRRSGLTLEDGLTPLAGEHAQALLAFTASENLNEIHLMLSTGMLTGARIGTITTLAVHNVEAAMPDPNMAGFHRIPVGSGTGVKTKFDVSGDLLVPSFLVNALMSYAYSMSRLRRQAIAAPKHRGCLFLTSRGNPYRPQSFNRLMTDLRRRAIAAGLFFMRTFKFHQTRCTYGTWLMELALRVANESAALAFVQEAMLHKDEATTFRYIRFNRQSPIKALISNEFSSAFSGLVNRDWSKFAA